MTPLKDKIRKQMTSAIAQYDLISTGDRVLVAVSGGKDSSIMLMLLEEIRRRAPFEFSIEAVLVDQKQPGFEGKDFFRWVESLGIKLHVIDEDTYSIVIEKTKPGKSYCGLCSRLRRGILYSYAKEHGFSKIALGHHRDDLNETLLMNLFYGGKLASMPAKLHADDGENTVIRPLAFVPEKWLIGLREQLSIPVIPCNLCGSQDGLVRQKMKKLLLSLEEDHPEVGGSMLAALQDVRGSQLLDRRLF